MNNSAEKAYYLFSFKQASVCWTHCVVKRSFNCSSVVSGERRAEEGEEDCGPTWERDTEDSLGNF